MIKQLLETSIEYLKGVGPKRAEVLNRELGIFRFADLLYYFPFRYVDRSRFYKVAEIQAEMPYVQLRGHIVSLETIPGKGRSARMKAKFADDSGQLELVWFTGVQWIKNSLQPNVEYIVFGKPSFFNGKPAIAHPEIEPSAVAQERTGGALQPVYSSTEKAKAAGLDSRGLLKLMRTLIDQLPGKLDDPLPADLVDQLHLADRNSAIRGVHLPGSVEEMQKARFRLKFEELFFNQLKQLKAQGLRKMTQEGYVLEKIDGVFDRFYHHHLPFQLTGAQKRVIREIRKDVLSGKQMNRLLQGDVGSGKTIVALMTLLMAVDNGLQGALLAPTEILAGQHFQNISEVMEGMDVNVKMLTGSTKKAERKIIHEELENGSLHILIGTHAILEEPVNFQKLGMAVIDEQHRFGVAQRARLWKKNQEKAPHILVMTATPIPRTLAMTLYGDLDVSVIDELPPGRKPIKTVHRYDMSRQKVYDLMRQELDKGRQIYVVYPLIEESEKMDYKNLQDGYDQIREAFPGRHVSIMHGRLTPENKEYEMRRFVKGETHIMVATTVIEVGVNVPNASVMVIESAERFGLSQLHQLRGRVGRGAEQSYCVLVTPHKLSQDGRTRMETLCRTNDGFEIAEVDLRLRGPGDIEGTRQSGVMDFKLADITKDQKILQLARDAARMVLTGDPELSLPSHQPLLRTLEAMQQGKTNWARIS